MKSIKTKLRLKRNKSDYNKNRKITNKSLVYKLNQEGKIKNGIEKILQFKKPKAYSFNPKYDRSKSEDKDNQLYNETSKLINNYNQKFAKNIKIYKDKKDENVTFIEGYKNYKKTNVKKKFIKEIEKKNYIFGRLLNLYDKKLLKIPSKFFENDIYKDSAILFCKKSKIDEYFDHNISDKKKCKKTIKFLEKLSDQTQKVYKSQIISQIGNNSALLYDYDIDIDNEKDFDNGNDNDNDNDNNNSEEEDFGKPRIKINQEDLFDFYEKINSYNQKIKKYENEIQTLQKLISIEEKEHNKANDKQKIMNQTFMNKKIKNKRVSFENENSTQVTFYNILNIKKKLSNANNNSFLNITRYTSSTIVPKFTSINTEKKFLKSQTKNVSSKNSNSNLDLSISNNANLGSNDNYIKNNIDNNSIKKVPTNNNSYISIEPENENLRLSLGLVNNRRMSNRNIQLTKSKSKSKSINLININPSILKIGLKNKRKSCLPVINNISTKKNEPQKNPVIKKENKTLNNSKSNFNSKSIKEIYEKISKNFLSSNKRLKNVEKLNELLKEFYGDKMKKNNKANSIDCYEVYNNYYKTKGKIMLFEKNNKIYTHYKEIIPNMMVNKINTSNEQDEKLKNYPVDYFKAICKKKFTEDKDV